MVFSPSRTTCSFSDLCVIQKFLSSEVSVDSDINYMPAVKIFLITTKAQLE